MSNQYFQGLSHIRSSIYHEGEESFANQMYSPAAVPTAPKKA